MNECLTELSGQKLGSIGYFSPGTNSCQVSSLQLLSFATTSWEKSNKVTKVNENKDALKTKQEHEPQLIDSKCGGFILSVYNICNHRI